MQLTGKLGALAMAGGLATLVLAATPALASSHAGAATRTGPEVISGTLTGQAALVKVPKIPLTFAAWLPPAG